MVARQLSTFVFMAAAAFAVSAFAAVDVFVAADGDDANDGLSSATAKATIAAAYDVLTNGAFETTYGNRLVVGEGTFDLPSTTVFLTNGWKVVGAGKFKTTMNVTGKTNQFALASADTEIRGFTIDFGGTSMNMKCYEGTTKELSGALVKEPRGVLADLNVVNYYTSWGGTLVYMEENASEPVFTNCTFRNFTLNYRNSLISIKRGKPLIGGCSFIDGTCRKPTI